MPSSDEMIRALRRGWRRLRCHKKAVACVYLANLLVAGLLAIPFLKTVDRSLGDGVYRQKLANNLDYDWLMLFRDRVSGFASTFDPTVLGLGPFARNLQALLDGKLAEFPWALLVLGGIYIFLSSFLLAAALSSFALDPKGTTIRRFFHNGREFFSRFFRVTILALLTFGLVIGWIVQPLASLVNHIAAGALTEVHVFVWNLLRYVFLVVILTFLNMVFDYTKIKTALEDRTSVFLAVLSSSTFCITNFLPAYGLYLLITGIGALWVLIYGLVDFLLPQRSWWTILLAFGWLQFYILGRLTIKLLFYSSQMQFLSEREGLRRAIEAAPAGPTPQPEHSDS